MNILIVSHYGLYSDFSFSFVHAQAKAFAEQGHTVKVIVPIAMGKKDWHGRRFGGHSFSMQGVMITPVRHLSLSNYGKKCFNTYSAISAIRRQYDAIFRDFTPDVIHAHTLGFDSEIGAWMKEQLHVPLVVTTHGSDTSIPVEQGRAAELKSFCDHADQVVAVSSALANKLHTCKTKTPISVILNGFNLRELPKCGEKKPCSLIQVGHLNQQKKVDVSIQAFALLHKKYPESTLTIIGEGPEHEGLLHFCEELCVQDTVRFLGQVPNKKVLEEMSRHQFFVMPSIREGFGIVYLEAMSSGCITIGTEGEGIADLIVHGENGFLVPPDEPAAIVKVIDWCLVHPTEADAIAERGCREAQELTWEQNVAQYLQLFHALIRLNSSV